jgi:sporulation protein YlmC with PRC-barrel domain
VDFPVRASQLIEASVASGEGENLGRVKDLIVNIGTGRIEAALVSKSFMVRQGSVTGLGEILVPVPWRALQIGTERRFIVSVDQDKAAARSDADPNGSHGPGFAVHILGFFESEPSAGMGGPGDDEVESGRGGGQNGPFEEGTSAPHPREL